MTVHRVKLSDYKAQKADEGAIEIEVENGTVYRIAPPELWPDEILEMVKNGEVDPVAQARALIGDEYDEFVAAGGSAALVSSIVGEIHGETVPE